MKTAPLLKKSPLVRADLFLKQAPITGNPNPPIYKGVQLFEVSLSQGS